jgi:tetratricopeptide (TPR) repeat protein
MPENPPIFSRGVVQSELQRVFQDAFENHQKGRLAKAIELYRRCLKIAPDHYDSAYLLAVSINPKKLQKASDILILRFRSNRDAWKLKKIVDWF